MSAGTAPIDGRFSPEGVLKNADVALYEAKRAGGDRHASSGQAPEPHVV